MRATMFIPSCLVLFAVVSVQCADVNYSHKDTFRGRNTTPGEQCIDVHPQGISGVCKTHDPAKRCTQLICAELLRTDVPTALEFGPAFDGTWCGDKKICYKGACIDDPQPPENPLEIMDFQYDCQQ